MVPWKRVLFEHSWVGIISWENRDEFIAVTVQDDSITADLPDRRLFRLPLEITDANNNRITWQLRLPEGLFTCIESRQEESIESICRSPDDEKGHLISHRIKTIESKDFKDWMGHYDNNQQQTLYVGQDPRFQVPLYFYEHNNALVRLYPIIPYRFLSERCEEFYFGKGLDGISEVAISSRYQLPDLYYTTTYQEEHALIPTPDGHVLGASLAFPHTPAPHPVVLFCHYADTHFRDYYRLFADYFLQQGIATLIYDKRGWGDSTGESLFSSIFPLADDAVAVYEYLHHHPLIQSDKIGFWGASNGAWVAPLAASRVNHPAFVIAVSSAGVTPAYQEQIRRVNIVREQGASEEAVALLERMWQLLMDFYVTGRWIEETAEVLQQVYDHEELQALPKQADYGPGLQAVPPIIPIGELKATGGGTWAEGGFDPAPIYASLNCPLLFVWGDKDMVVSLEDSHHRIETALTQAHHPDFQIVRLPNTTHKMYQDTPPVEGLQPHEVETRLHGVRFAPDFREQMALWATQRLF